MKIGGVPVPENDPNFGLIVQKENQKDTGGGGTVSDDEVDEQIVLKALAKRGVQVDSLEKIMVKPEKELEITDDVLKKVWTEAGNKEDFDEVKSLLSADTETLAKKRVMKELKEIGLTDEQAEKYYKSRYYVTDDDDDNYLTDEQKQIGQKLREKKASMIKADAEAQIKRIEDIIKGQSAIKKANETWKKTAEQVLSEKRNLVFEVGENDEKVPVNFEIGDDDYNEVLKDLANPDEMRKLLLNEHGHHNVEALAELLIWKKIGQKIISHAFNIGETQVSSKLGGVLPGYVQPLVTRGDGSKVRPDANKNAERNRKSINLAFGVRP